MLGISRTGSVSTPLHLIEWYVLYSIATDTVELMLIMVPTEAQFLMCNLLPQTQVGNSGVRRPVLTCDEDCVILARNPQPSVEYRLNILGHPGFILERALRSRCSPGVSGCYFELLAIT